MVDTPRAGRPPQWCVPVSAPLQGRYARKRGGTAFSHLYGTARWQRTRKAQLDRQPLCEYCAKRKHTKVATVCNHTNGHPAGETEQQFWEGPFNSLCADCHNSDQARIEKGAVQIRGCDADGWPI